MGWQKIMLIWGKISSMKDKKADLGRCGSVQENKERWQKGRECLQVLSSGAAECPCGNCIGLAVMTLL